MNACIQKALPCWNDLTAKLDKVSCLTTLIARISVGYVFIESGWGKLHNLEKVTEYFASLHIPMPGFNAVFAASSELIFGALLLVGLATRLATIPLTIVMLVALATAKHAELAEGGFSALTGMIEYLYIVIFLMVLTRGPGTISLDYLLNKKLSSPSI